MKQLRWFFVAAMMFGASRAQAQIIVPPAPVIISNISYVNWSAATIGTRGLARGSIVISNLYPVGVTYEGEVAPATQIDTGINYWEPATPYLSNAISNAPPAPDIIALIGGTGFLNTLTFDEPVEDPVLTLVSLGQIGLPVTYIFDASFELLSQGPGYWGAGTLFQSEPNQLIGNEGHGAIQFRGIYSSLSWAVPDAENWHGFTLGVPIKTGPAPAVIPEGKVWITGLGACLVAALGWRRRFRRGG